MPFKFVLEPFRPPRVGLITNPSIFVTFEEQGRHLQAAAILGNRHEREIGSAGQLACSRQQFLGIDVDLRFERCVEGARHARLEDDQIADLDWIQKLQAVDRGGHQQAPRVTMTCDRAGDVDEVHHGAAENETQRIGVVRQHHLHHFGGRSGGGLGREIHRRQH